MKQHMSPGFAKLVLPTVESCPHRQQFSGGDVRAACELLQTISGVAVQDHCEVQLDACRACCESFPPSREVWNPVIASLLMELSQRVLDCGGVAGCSPASAAVLQARAAGAIDVEISTTKSIVPARHDGRCCHLGESLGSDDGQAQMRCHHPAHPVTTPDNCRMCRDWSLTQPVSRFMSLSELVPISSRRQAAKIRRWATGVVTAPRREGTLEWCLDSVVRAGWETPHLFVDGLVRVPAQYAHLPITWRERPVGAWPNYWLALAELVQAHTDADAYLLLQDDAVLYDRGNLRLYLEEALWPDDEPSLVSLYCSQAYTVLEPGWHVLSQPWIWGALAFVFPRELARQFVSDPNVVAHRWTGSHDGRSQVDAVIGQWAESRRRAVHYSCPSLAQHVGNTSSIWEKASNNGWRRADWFANDLETPFARDRELSHFPEELFPCRSELREEYLQRVEIGRQRMLQRRIVICGLCRNVRHFLPKFAARTERLGGMFRDYRVVLFENDSTDATIEFLLDWQKLNDRVNVLSQRFGTIRYPQIRCEERAARMAEYRNRYRAYALQTFGDFDDILVADTDLAGGWSYDGLANTFGHDEWDFVGSYGLLRVNGTVGSELVHFDAWAFRAMGHPQPHTSLEVNRTVLNRGEPLLPVLGCFGGLAVYRMAAMKSACYGSPDQEHAELHRGMRTRGFDRQFLNPSQIVLYSPE